MSRRAEPTPGSGLESAADLRLDEMRQQTPGGPQEAAYSPLGGGSRTRLRTLCSPRERARVPQSPGAGSSRGEQVQLSPEVRDLLNIIQNVSPNKRARRSTASRDDQRVSDAIVRQRDSEAHIEKRRTLLEGHDGCCWWCWDPTNPAC